MRRNYLIVAALVGSIFLLTGCQANAKRQANALATSIKSNTARVNAAVDNAIEHSAAADAKVSEAESHMAKADAAVQVVIVAPETPLPIKTTLTPAHTELAAASASLKDAHTEHAAVIAATQPIKIIGADTNAKSDQAAAVTAKVSDALVTEQNHWLGKKTRDLLTTLAWVLGAGALVFGVIVLLVKTNGGGPILAAFGTIGGGVIERVWSFTTWVEGYVVSAAKLVGTAIWHVSTLGMAYFADKINHQKAVAAAAPPAPPPLAPANAANPNVPEVMVATDTVSQPLDMLAQK